TAIEARQGVAWGNNKRLFMLQRAQQNRFRDGRGREAAALDAAMPMAAPGGFGGAGGPVMKAEAKGAAPPMEAIDRVKDKNVEGGGGGGAAPITRVREYFPETLLWQPALITDDKGVAVMPLTFADSITTWRLSASASSKAGSLGGVSAPLRVFQ